MNINNQYMTHENKPDKLALLPDYLKNSSKIDKKESHRLIEIYVDGINAEARVIQIEEAGLVAGRLYCKMILDVRPSHSGKFKTTGFTPVSGSLMPKAGDTINIKYNPSDKEKFVIL